jgi:hypothetical protein
MMSTLTALKLSTSKKSQSASPAVQRRNKLCRKLTEQIQLAKAHLEGAHYQGKRLRSIRDEDGVRRVIEVPKTIRPWWWNSDNGKIALNVRYGARVVEIAKGKSAVEVATPQDLIPTLEVIKRAVEAGELDAQIETASIKLRENFNK